MCPGHGLPMDVRSAGGAGAYGDTYLICAACQRARLERLSFERVWARGS